MPLPASPASVSVHPPSVHKPWRGAMWQHYVASRTRLQLVALAVFAIGLVSLIFESTTVGVVRHSVDFVQVAWQRVSYSDPTRPPPPVFATETERLCYYQRDVGLIDEILSARREFCKQPSTEANRRTHVSIIDLNDSGFDMRAMTFGRDLALDFTQTTIHAPIASMAHDGGRHDPRFNWDASMIACGCDKVQAFAQENFVESNSTTTLRLWDPQFAKIPVKTDEASTVCASPSHPQKDTPLIEIREKTILIARRDDHNPFFQISNALNAWLLMKSLGWRRDETRVIHLDGGYTSPIDSLHHNLLSTPSNFPLLRGREDLLGNRFHFTNEVMVSPYELSGPMMQHLNDQEPCYDSQLFKDFRAQSLHALDVYPDAIDTSRQITVTIISRRNYGGRKIQRRWRNEDQVVTAMREKYQEYENVPIIIQSVDFVHLTLQQQMETALKSDVVIGMHGAGMVNVMWTRPETLVVEIFPKRRLRWGYRNLCQFLGCEWHQFRGGKDTGKGDNGSDKTIPVDVWAEFFDPLMTEFLAKVVVGKQPALVDEQPQRLRR